MRMPFADPIHDTPGFAPALQRYGTMPCCRPVERKHRAPVPSCGERGFLDFEMGTATETEEDTPAFASSSIARGVGGDRLSGGMGDQGCGWGIVVAIRQDRKCTRLKSRPYCAPRMTSSSLKTKIKY